MDLEMYELMDETMGINHQIGKYLEELAKKEEQGQIVEIEKSKILKTLFQRLQQKYRLLAEKMQEEKTNIDEEYENITELTIDDPIARQQLEMITFGELQSYLEISYLQLRYISLLNKEGEIIEPSIFEKHPYYELKQIEYQIQQEALENMEIRLEFRGKVTHLSPQEKANVLNYLSFEKFYKTYVFKQMNQYIEEIKQKKGMTEKQRQKTIHALIQKKYVLYYEYLNHQYNGIIQKNDIGEFSIIKKFLEEEATGILLNMDQFEIDENIKLNLEGEKEDFKQNIKEIFEENTNVNQEEKQKKKGKEEINLKVGTER